MRYDCIVVGGGAAGLSAALMLGLCRRRVLVCDAGDPRNRWSRSLHGYLTRDGVRPQEFHRLARAELARYETIELRELTISDARRMPWGFEVVGADGSRLECRKLLLATGMRDDLPDIPGLGELYGISVHHCPYCDAWEWRDAPVAVYGRGEKASGLALGLTVWTRNLVLCTDGNPGLPDFARERIQQAGIRLREERILCLEGHDGTLERIIFAQGEPLPRRALFLATESRQRSELPARLGCRFTEHGAVDTGRCEATNVPGLFVAGDASKEAQFVIVAAAEGTEAAMAINQSLLSDDLAAHPVESAVG